jgi:cytochrome c biogenesis protein CcmG/thiol:disulfide interchange protein DsbE
MKRRVVLLGSLSALVLVVAFSVFLATRHTVTDATSSPSPLLGKPAPAVRGVSLSGKKVSLVSDRGHVVVLNFWASWCQPCKQEAPELSSFAWQQRNGGARVVGVVFNDSVSAAKSFNAYYGSLYPSVAQDTNGSIANSYGVTSPPTTFIIDRHGRVVAELLGATTDRQLTAVVDKITS